MAWAWRGWWQALCVCGGLLLGLSAAGVGLGRPPASPVTPISNSHDARTSIAPRELAPGCTGLGPEPCDPRQRRCQELVFELVRCLSGTPEAAGMQPPVVEFVDTERMRLHASQALAPMRQRAAQRQRALALFGLSRVQPHDSGTPPAGLTLHRRVLVQQSADAERLLITLAHEFVHALQDVATVVDGDMTLDDELFRRAQLEGEAYYYERMVQALVQNFQPTDLRQDFRSQPATAERLAPLYPLPLTRTTSLLYRPYGMRYAALSRAHAFDSSGAPGGGTAELLRRTEPAHPLEYRQAQPSAPRLEAAELVLLDRWGPWLVRTYLAWSLRDSQLAATLVGPLRGDALRLYTTVSGEVAIWSLTFASHEAASATARALTSKPHRGPHPVASELKGHELSLSVHSSAPNQQHR